MIFVFYFFAAILVFLGYKSLRGGIDYLNFFKQEINKPKSEFAPFASVIAPCRGLDEDLETNLSALFRQEYPNYEIVFAVDDEQDEAVSVIKNLIQRRDAETRREEEKVQSPKSKVQSRTVENTVAAKLAIAGKTANESQKVHNLRQAVGEVSIESKVFVFVDSDARPDKDWLRNLIAPLADETIGAATGYRWFVAKRGNLASELRSVWNASIASALGANIKNNFCWGGATAIRRETFEKLGINEKWRGVLSDDFAVTRILQSENLSIRFVPQCLTATVEDCSFRELVEFTTRQIKITRVYAPHLWKMSFVGSVLFSVVFLTGIALLFFTSGWDLWMTLGFLLVIFTLGAAKARLRLNAVKLVLKDYEKELNRSFLWQVSLWTTTPILFFFNCLSALLSRKIVWRGIEYELVSPNETKIINQPQS